MLQVEQTIPSKYSKLYADYVDKVRKSKKVDTIMWVVLDRGHRIEMIGKEKHRAMIEQLLGSGDVQRMKVAEEVMRRSIGTWEVR